MRTDSESEQRCLCATLSDLAVVPMGGSGLDDRVFATVDVIRHHSGDLWWLYLARCNACGQRWLVAQEERIFDDYFLRRTSEEEGAAIAAGCWPDDFITYERVLKIGRALSKPCRFLDPLAGSLVWSAHDLRNARSDITVDEIAWLLGVTAKDAKRLLAQTG